MQRGPQERRIRRGGWQALRMKSNDTTRDTNSEEEDTNDDEDSGEEIQFNIPRTPEELQEMEENKVIEEKVQLWIKNVVVGLNLCPFAERPMRENKLRLFTVRGDDEEKLLSSIFVVLLLQESKPGTSIIICPECHPNDFQAYLDVVHSIEHGMMEEHDLTGVLQVAPFHPLFQFEGSDEHGIDNWTNRSPYPIFHIIREDEVERAAESLDGDASRVWKRNVGLLQALEDALGPDGVERIFSSRATPEEKARVSEILKQHRLVMKPRK